MNQNTQIHCLIDHAEKIGALTDDFAFIKLLPLNQNEYVLTELAKTSDQLKNTFLDQNEFMQDIIKRAKQNRNKVILVAIQKKILQGLMQSNKICVSSVSSINQKILQKIIIKLQMPQILLKTEVISLEVIGFKYNCHSRIKDSKLKKSILYLQENDMNELYQEIEYQRKRFLSLYDKKDWTNATQYFSLLSIEIEPIIKINKLQSHHFTIKPIGEAICRKDQIFQLLNADEKESGLLRCLRNLKSRLQTEDKASKQLITNWSLIPQKIANPHIFLKTTSKDKYLKYFTKGSYEYYHYSDQQFNDQGWGCAYRSLQTVLSWFQLRGSYTAGPMLSIPQIQELIDRINIGGQQKLKGTRQWIGATEVSWVIQKIIGINCKILHASDGKDVLSHCQQFRSHLERVGSPIMYGGGEYAYSIVGLNYNWKLGDCQFLILDPHYSGSDSIDKIIEKKGVCWRKAQQMFKKGIFYNFCLPLLQ